MTAADDTYLWLEDITGDDALTWVRERNEATVTTVASGPAFAALSESIRDVLDTDARIPYVRPRAEHLYNFWKDADHPRGLWRRTTLGSFRSPDTEWDVLIDLDALADAEGENWVWKSAQVLRPAQDLALVSLSRGGADASVVREFDLRTRTFRPAAAGGFTVPEAKTVIGWIDEDSVFVGTDTGAGSMTDSGYARQARRWVRGTELAAAPVVFEGEQTDVLAAVKHDRTEGFERSIAERAVDFYNSERALIESDGTIRPIDIPTDASMSVHREWMLVRTVTEWTVAGHTYPAGSLLAANVDRYLAGERELSVVFTPDSHSALHQFAWTRGHVILVVLRDVASEVFVATPTGDGWNTAPLTGLPALTMVEVLATDSDIDDSFYLDSSGYLTPSTLLRGEIGGDLEALREAPAFFDTEGLSVSQFFATSDDGTQVPYFVVRRDDASAGPTLLYGYGGFEVSRTPAYSPVMGRAWLARGGTFVMANIRGGGEYGPTWHTQAVKAGRHLVGEDFASVARDLVARGITTVAQLGAQGGSNGGLLMGIMLTKYPELFGALVCQVPLLDMKRFHLLLAGASWMAEYGNPDDPQEWAIIEQYSPYQNVDPDRDYPPILITTSTRDDRVHPGHARKMAALLAEHGKDVTYYENIEGGHGGAADNRQLAFMSSLAYEYLWTRLTR